MDEVNQTTNRGIKMSSMSLTIFFVDNVGESSKFYQDLLAAQPLEQSSTFAMLKLPGNGLLGLWSRHSVNPPLNNEGTAAELALTKADRLAVDACFNDWQKQGITILQSPTTMSFGYTFLVSDPDGYRLRIFSPE